ncbi:MAG: hypothetical protein K0R29_1645 [Pseudobdellovibrio sp.]|nr:hypothetical protein [Pseudobdellovibrio sp.]
MRNAFQTLVFIGVLFIVGCAHDLPVKTVRDNPANENTEAPKESEPAVVTPTIPPPPAEPTATTERKEDIKLSSLEIQKFAYELGLDPKKPLSDDEKKQIANRKRLRELERALDSSKERLQYSKVLPWLKNDDEKIELLNIPSVEGRQVWINKNRIWSRAQDLKEFDEVVESQDIALGMPAEYVKKSWGEPVNVEISGNPIYRNERWQYNKQVATPQGYKQEKRYVYFEGGRVVGWETE